MIKAGLRRSVRQVIEDGQHGRGRQAARPLDAARLNELALAYVARFATSAGKLGGYLRRKLRERGWAGEAEPADAAAAVVARMVAAGYVDDAGFARARSESLARRGLGRRRIAQELGMAGISGQDAAAALPGARAARAAALALARKRRFGPYDPGERAGEAWRARRQKQIAAMLRAGHPLDSVRELVDAASVAAAEEWAGAGADGGSAEDGDE
ncbi:MAG TPA: RecX family transcriptional regulator [Myxococcales bacterium]